MFKKISQTTMFLALCFMFLSMTAVLVQAEETNTFEDGYTITEKDREKLQQKREAEQAKLKAQQEKIKTEKEKLKAKNLEQAKKKVNEAIDRAIRKLNKIKDRVKNMPTVANDLKTRLNSKLDEWISKLNSRKAAVNAATTKDELKSAMEGFKADVKEAKRIIKDIVEAIHKTHLQKVIAKIEAFIPKIEEKVAAITDASKKAEATELVNNAKAQIANAKTITDAGKIEEARKAIKQAYWDLKNALEIVNEKEGSNE